MNSLIDKNGRIFIAGHKGMVGSAILRCFQNAGYRNFITRTHAELDLRNQNDVKKFFDSESIDYVIVASAKVGGIGFNSAHNAEFLLENLQIQNNVIEQAWLHHVKKLCFLGSSCIYPREAQNPIRENSLLTGPLEPTNEGYAIAKIAGYKLCRFLSEQYGFRVVCPMPCNLYGPNDHFHITNSHVLAAMVRRFCDAADSAVTSVTCWGTGTPLREFLHVDDLAKAVLMLMEQYEEPDFINVGSGAELSIRNLAEITAKEAGYTGTILWDASKPDGMMRKIMDISRISALGWKPQISLSDGIAALCAEYRTRRKAGEFEKE